MPSAQETIAAGLETIAKTVTQDPGLLENVALADISGGTDGARLMNDVILQAIVDTGVNADGALTPDDIRTISDYIRETPALYADFVEGHGNDEGQLETGFHLVQGDGGSFMFQGRHLVDNIADAIYHVGFEYGNGVFLNEDGDANEPVDDIAGWLNFFVNGVNVVYGTDAGETLYSGDYSPELSVAADEVFYAGAGDDLIWPESGNDIVWAGAGNDVAAGGDGNDLLIGEAGDDRLWGDAGNDELHGDAGSDTLGGGLGDDTLHGGADADNLWGDEGSDIIYGDDGNDVIDGGSGDDGLVGGNGNDEIWGGDGADVMYGGAGADTLGGGIGNDELYGDEGADELWGNEGDDFILGGADDDLIGGGDGDDVISGDDGQDTLWGEAGHDWIYGGQGVDRIGGGDGNDHIEGGDGVDTVFGDAGDDVLSGDAGNDLLYGGNDNDTLIGGSGDDLLNGQEGSDLIYGGAGVDRLVGWDLDGARDVFIFGAGDSGTTASTMDLVEGFVSGEDQIDLSSYGNLSFVAVLSGSGAAEVTFDGDYIWVDGNGDGVADLGVELQGIDTVAASDFLL
ncbi:calcium-binding protein [Litoreibacter janthinus]|uniref:Ca2+-binding protein, RTX toxin-related n=1 Tax=Litoreibacter janthinus TaxID=670154 RepID=A0A1I6G9D8_9RHOB|nr:calcium-binding protein [Litoreibacter janthinus]SFR38803.1 Ca2+-binding protein, RTX toxin-related [Litoreibacter janthinus]